MQNIWSKAYFYQLNQPKVPHPPDDQCWLVNLGQKQHCCWGKGWSDFVPIYFALDCRPSVFKAQPSVSKVLLTASAVFPVRAALYLNDWELSIVKSALLFRTSSLLNFHKLPNTMADWDSMGHVVTQTRGQAF